MSKPALFIIDMVNDSFVHDAMKAMRRPLCEKINELIDYARRNEFHIIWVRQEYEADLSDAFLEMREEKIEMYINGTKGAMLLDELNYFDDDYGLIKKRYSMFYDTELDDYLDTIHPSEIILCGVNTHACIRMAAIDAYQRDRRSTIISDCIASPNAEHHRVSLEYLGHRIAKIESLDEFKGKFV